MAKLSARGRTCQVEIMREFTEEQLQARHDKVTASYTPGYVAGSDPSLTVWERVTRRLMSDGKILEKIDVRFRPSPNCSWEDPKGRRYSYAWKVSATLKAGCTAEDYVRIYSGPTKSGKPSPWTVSSGTATRAIVPAKVISQKRIMRAIESGESVGFCTSCGAEAYGVEPDAHDYKCESCGQMTVTGAEELLMQGA
jgi:predicted RNA-binding Zn-ribbon protein involved in translation (DUF1610 family)